MKLLVFEALTSGYIRNRDSSIMAEALAMLKAVVNDFYKMGLDVSVVINKELLGYSYGLQGNIIKVDKLDISILKRLAIRFDYTYIIAPEADGIYSNLLSNLEGLHLNPEVDAINQVINKEKLYNNLRSKGFYVPSEYPIDNESFSKSVSPLIIKPKIGIGCEGMRLVTYLDQFKDNLSSLDTENFIIQEFIPGIPSSISLVTDGSTVIPLSINRQFIRYRPPGYFGGYTPLDLPIEINIFKLSEKIMRLYPQLKGYVGIDLVISNDKVYIMEINPRLTVSYVGLSHIIDINPAKLIINASINKLDHYVPRYIKSAYFHKTRVEGNLMLINKVGYRDIEVFTPPIPIENKRLGFSFILSTGETVEEAKLKYVKFIEKANAVSGLKTHP
jgi:hypothetical protein